MEKQARPKKRVSQDVGNEQQCKYRTRAITGPGFPAGNRPFRARPNAKVLHAHCGDPGSDCLLHGRKGRLRPDISAPPDLEPVAPKLPATCRVAADSDRYMVDADSGRIACSSGR